MIRDYSSQDSETNLHLIYLVKLSKAGHEVLLHLLLGHTQPNTAIREGAFAILCTGWDSAPKLAKAAQCS